MWSSGAGFVTSAVILWSLSVPVGRVLTESMGIFAAGSVLYLVGGVIGVVIIWRREGARCLQVGDMSVTALRGVLFVGYCCSLYSAIGIAHETRDLTLISAINYQWPILTVVVASLVGQVITHRGLLICSALLGVVGVLLVATKRVGELDLLLLAAGTIMLFGALSWACYSVVSARARDGTGTVFLFMIITGVLLMGVQCALHGSVNWSALPPSLIPYLAVPALSYFLWERGLSRIGAYRAGMIALLTPLGSTLALATLPGSGLTMWSWAGMFLVVGAALMAKRAQRERGATLFES